MYKAFNIKHYDSEYIIPYQMVVAIRVSSNDTELNIMTTGSPPTMGWYCFKGLDPETTRELLDGYEDWLQK